MRTTSINLSPRATAILASSVLSVLPLADMTATADAANRVGVAAAVTPKATSTPPGAGTRKLKIGKSVFYNERITTSPSGVVQVLLVDDSIFTVGHRSSLVIDKFVYNPHKGTGEMTARLSKGALRFIGGKLSKQTRREGQDARWLAGWPYTAVLSGILNSRNQGSLRLYLLRLYGSQTARDTAVPSSIAVISSPVC